MTKETVVVSMKKTIGFTALDEVVRLELTIESITDKSKMTVDHKTVDHYRTVSISGTIRDNGRREPHTSGQINSTLRETAWNTLGVTEEEIAELLNLWDEWHLNDMQVRCNCQSHVDVNLSYGDWRAAADVESAKCTHGYSYGSGWLLKELPPEVEDRLIYLFT